MTVWKEHDSMLDRTGDEFEDSRDAWDGNHCAFALGFREK
jgi:hypothetical protein